PGYDLCTGWGTPRGTNMINALAPADDLQITPGAGFTASGGVGGPFTVTSQTYTLIDAGTGPLTWGLANTAPWLSASSNSGTLTPGGATTVTLSLNSAASNLLVGVYSTTVWFTNLNDGVRQSRQFRLNVIRPPVITETPSSQSVLGGATATF